jgi:hypothetical protein
MRSAAARTSVPSFRPLVLVVDKNKISPNFVCDASGSHTCCTDAVALDTPLNTRQLEVLRWISEGCPDGRWTDYTYKTTAKSLQHRRLVTVTKKSGWKATIEPAGVYYLKHGDYPADHFPNKRRSYSRIMRLAHLEAGKPQRPLTRPAADEPTPTRKLLQDIINAGGVLDLHTRGDETNYGSLVAIINPKFRRLE